MITTEARLHTNTPVHVASASADAQIAYRRNPGEASRNKSLTEDRWQLANMRAEGGHTGDLGNATLLQQDILHHGFCELWETTLSQLDAASADIMLLCLSIHINIVPVVYCPRQSMVWAAQTGRMPTAWASAAMHGAVRTSCQSSTQQDLAWF